MAFNDTKNLATEVEIKSYLSIDAATWDDPLSYIANGVMKAFQQETGRDLVLPDAGVAGRTYFWTGYYDGDGTDTLYLKNYPIISVSDLRLDSERAYTGSNEAANIVIYRDEGKIRLTDDVFPETMQSVKIEYVGGYHVTPTGSEVGIPDDLKWAYLLQIKVVWQEWRNNIEHVTQESVGPDSFSRVEPKPFHIDVQRVLFRYTTRTSVKLVKEDFTDEAV